MGQNSMSIRMYRRNKNMGKKAGAEFSVSNIRKISAPAMKDLNKDICNIKIK